MPLEESVALDIAEAQSRVDDIGNALTSAAQSFATALDEATQVLSSIRVEQVDATAVTSSIDEAVAASDISPTVTADASGVTSSIDEAVAAVGTPDVPVNADTAEIASSIDEAVGNASPPQLEVPVDAGEITSSIDSALSSVDTSGLQSELGDVSTAATGAGNAAKEAGLGIGSIAPAAALATGEVGGLTDIIGQVTPGMAAAATATVGVVAAGKDLFESALQQNTALARLRQTYGDLADSIEHVNFGGINEDLSTLAVRTGANVDGLRNFAASFGTLGTSAGDTLPHIANVSQQIELLATRASVLNPNLGTADEIVQRLSTSLARGGRFLSIYGISLSTAQINAEALSETGKRTASELSIYDKIVAGATLATQKLGTSLGTDINDGAQKAQVQLNALKAAFEETLKSAGAPLIQPVIDAFRELEPVLAALAQILGVGLAGALHVVGPLLQGLAAVLTPIADAAKQIPTPVIEAATAFLLFTKVGPLLAGLLDNVISFATLGSASFAGFGATAETTAAEVDAAAGSMDAALGPVAAAFAAVAAPIAAAAAIGAGAGFIFAKLTDDSKELGAGLATLQTNFANASKSIDDSVTTFTRMQIAAQDGKTALADIGVSAAQVADDALHGKTGFEAFLATLVGTGKISQQAADELLRTGESAEALKIQMDHGQSGVKGLDDSAVHLIDTFSRVQTVTNDVAHDTLTAAVNHGQLTRAEEVAAIAANTARDGHVNWLGVLRQLQPQLQAASTATQVYGSQAAATNPVVQHAADVQKQFGDALNTTGVSLEAGLIRSGQYTQAQIDAANALNTNKDGTVDYKGALDALQPGLGAVATAQANLAGGLDTTAGKFALADAAAKNFQTQLDEILNPIVSATDADVKWHQSIDDMTAALNKNGNTIDLNTQKGRDNVSALDAMVSFGTAVIDKMIAEGATTDQLNAKKADLISQLKLEEQHYPALTPLIDTYIDKINGIPLEHPTNVGLPNAGVAASDADLVSGHVQLIPTAWGVEVVVNTGDAINQLDDLRFAAIQARTALDNTGIPLGPLTAGGGARAGGGPVWPGEWTVGEAGPEKLFLTPTGLGFVVPLTDSSSVERSAGGQPVNITNNVFESVTPEATARAVSNRVAAAIKL